MISLLLSSTFDGSLIDLTRGKLFIDYTTQYIKSNFREIEENMNLFKSILKELNKLYLFNLYNYGTYFSLYFEDESSMRSLSDFLTSRKILHNPTPPNAIRLRPPLNLTK